MALRNLRLSRANLPALAGHLRIPIGDPADLTAGIVHIGVGNFHRAHQAVYLHDLFDRGRRPRLGMVGAGVRDADAAMRARPRAQDWLTTVVEQEAGRSQRAGHRRDDRIPRPGDARGLISRGSPTRRSASCR